MAVRSSDQPELNLSFWDESVQKNFLASYRIPKLSHWQLPWANDGIIVRDRLVHQNTRINFQSMTIRRWESFLTANSNLNYSTQGRWSSADCDWYQYEDFVRSSDQQFRFTDKWRSILGRSLRSGFDVRTSSIYPLSVSMSIESSLGSIENIILVINFSQNRWVISKSDRKRRQAQSEMRTAMFNPSMIHVDSSPPIKWSMPIAYLVRCVFSSLLNCTSHFDKNPKGRDREGHVVGGIQQPRTSGFTEDTKLSNPLNNFRDERVTRYHLDPYQVR